MEKRQNSNGFASELGRRDEVPAPCFSRSKDLHPRDLLDPTWVNIKPILTDTAGWKLLAESDPAIWCRLEKSMCLFHRILDPVQQQKNILVNMKRSYRTHKHFCQSLASRLPAEPQGSCKEIKSSLVALQNGTNGLLIQGIFKNAGFLLLFATCTSAAKASFAFLGVTARFLKPTCKMFAVFYKQ